MKKIVIALISVGTLLAFFSCKHEPFETTTNSSTAGGNGTGGTGSTGGSNNTCDPNKVYFQQQVLPILTSNCTMSGCHDVASHQKGVVLTTYDYVMTTADVRPGNPAGSKIYKMITETDPSKRMPRGRPALSQDKIDLIYKWIQQGATNGSCINSACDVSNVTYSGTIKPIVTAKCVGCHSGATPANGTDFSIYNALKAKANDGRLWGAINHLPGYSPMPKNGSKLSDCEIAQFKKWIDNGALNN